MSSSSEIFAAPVCLNSQTASELYARRSEVFKYAVVDLNTLQDIDSAGVALLVKWAKSQGQAGLRLKNVPATALRLIKTYKLNALFELE